MTDRPILFSAPMVRALLDGSKTQTRRVMKLNGRYPDFCGGRGDLEDPTCWGWEDSEHGDWVTLEKDPGQRMGWRDWAGAYRPGDRLWVREAWRCKDTCDDVPPRDMGSQMPIRWEADGALSQPGTRYWISREQRHVPVTYGRHRPSIHMPRWASRLTLTVADVRVQRLQEISEADAWAEGCKPGDPDDNGNPFPAEEPDPSGKFSTGWDCARDWFLDLWGAIHDVDPWEANPWVVALTFDVARQNIDQMGD